MNTHRESGVKFMSPVSLPNLRFPENHLIRVHCMCVCVCVCVCVCCVCERTLRVVGSFVLDWLVSPLMGAFMRVSFFSFIPVVIIYNFSRTGRFRFLLGLLARVPGADLPGGGPGSRGIGISSFYGRVVRSLGVYS